MWQPPAAQYHQKQRTCVGLQCFDVCICGVTLVISKDSINNQGSWLTFQFTEAYTTAQHNAKLRSNKLSGWKEGCDTIGHDTVKQRWVEDYRTVFKMLPVVAQGLQQAAISPCQLPQPSRITEVPISQFVMQTNFPDVNNINNISLKSHFRIL